MDWGGESIQIGKAIYRSEFKRLEDLRNRLKTVARFYNYDLNWSQDLQLQLQTVARFAFPGLYRLKKKVLKKSYKFRWSSASVSKFGCLQGPRRSPIGRRVRFWIKEWRSWTSSPELIPLRLRVLQRLSPFRVRIPARLLVLCLVEAPVLRLHLDL